MTSQTEKVISFMRWGRAAGVISLLLVLGSLLSLTIKGLNLGLDFTGGTLIELHYEKAPNLESVRAQLNEAGYTGAVVVHFGSETELLIRLRSDAGESDAERAATNAGEGIVEALRQADPTNSIALMRSEVIGAQMGEELVSDGLLGVLTAFAGIFLYVAIRFQRKFSAGALIGLVHDVIIVLGFFSLFQLEFDLTVLAAVLAVIGYSINDTIVVADRIRENFRLLRETPIAELINISLTQTLGRTLVTSGTTLLVLLALLLVGGELIRNFSIALILGITVGTYSTIYVASSVMMWLNLSREDMMPPVKEGAELDELP
jgi:preprotein translocase subunit SecF